MPKLRDFIRRAREVLAFKVGRPFAMRRPRAGIWVNEDRALTCGAVFACTRVIAETIAALSWHVFRMRADGGRDIEATHPVDRLLHTNPNPEMTAFSFRETMQAHALLWGNGTAEIQRDRNEKPIALWPLPPDRVEIMRDDGGQLVYKVTQTNADPVYLPSRNVFHLRGMGWDGVTGYSIVAMARESISLGLAAERFGAAFFGNGARPGIILQHPNILDEAAQQNLKKSLEETHRGPDGAGRVLVLEEGMEWKPIGIPPEDAQFLETRKFQVEEIARWFRIPPHKIQQLENAHLKNIEQQSIEFVTDTILPWAIRWEQEADRKLFGRDSSRQLFTKLNLDTILRGDIKSRFEAFRIAREWGWMSANDVRRKEDLNPLAEGGDTYLVPLNYGPEKDIGKRPEPEPVPPIGESEEDNNGNGSTRYAHSDRF